MKKRPSGVFFLSFAEFEAVYWALAVLAWPRDLVLKVWILKCPACSVARPSHSAKRNPKHQRYDISTPHGVADKASSLDSLFGGSHMAGVAETVL